MRFSPHFQLFYFNDRLEFCEFFEWKIKRINNADLFSQPPLVIFTKGANISGGHCKWTFPRHSNLLRCTCIWQTFYVKSDIEHPHIAKMAWSYEYYTNMAPLWIFDCEIGSRIRLLLSKHQNIDYSGSPLKANTRWKDICWNNYAILSCFLSLYSPHDVTGNMLVITSPCWGESSLQLNC